jgi:hypothetical protein
LQTQSFYKGGKDRFLTLPLKLNYPLTRIGLFILGNVGKGGLLVVVGYW